MNLTSSTAERRARLLAHPDVAVWEKDTGRPGTRVTHLDLLELFLRRTDLDVDGLLNLARGNPREFRCTVLDTLHSMQEEGRKAKYVGNMWWTVRSFLKSAAVAPDWNPKIERGEVDEVDDSRVVPTHTQLREIVNAVKSARDRMVVLLLASSGVRIGTLATQVGPADGLRLRDLIDLRIDDGEPRFERSPPLLHVPAHLSKGKFGYYSGLSDDAAGAVIGYLKERVHRGEKLGPASPLVLGDPRGKRPSRMAKDGTPFVVRKSIAARVKEAMDRVAPPGVHWSAHTLRAWFSTALETAEARGLVSRTRREYFAGHILGLGVDGVYNLNRSLTVEKREDLRAGYAKCLPYLRLAGPDESNPEAVRTEMLALLDDIAKTAGGKQAAVELVRDALANRAAGKKADDRASPTRVTGSRQQLVGSEELASLLGQGWRYVATVGQSVVVEPPVTAITG